MKNARFSFFLFCVLVSAPLFVQAQENKNAEQEPMTLQDLLELVKEGRVQDDAANKEREAKFLANRNQQKQLLDDTESKIKVEEARSERLEATFNANELVLAELEGLLQERLGVFGELFGVVRQVAGETRGQLENSIISGQHQGRTPDLNTLSKTKGLPSIKQLERLWYALQQEMTAQGEIVRFQGKIINDEGQTEPSEIVRVGPFTALADGEFLRYAGDGRFIKLGRQPPSRFLGAAGDLDGTDSDEMGVGVIDPSRGAILNLFLQTPTLFERIGQGGLVGYIIILLGLFGAGLACERILTLTRLSKKVQAQLETGSKEEDTPLGRVWAVYEANKMANTETIGLKLDDAILKEMPALEKGLTTIKLISGIAPLLGLLGTVTGMILTFQAITLFGTGDPKLMAGGISQALMTTVLGLVVAIPTLFLHSIASSRSREIVQILDEQATGLVATTSETTNA